MARFRRPLLPKVFLGAVVLNSWIRRAGPSVAVFVRDAIRELLAREPHLGGELPGAIDVGGGDADLQNIVSGGALSVIELTNLDLLEPLLDSEELLVININADAVYQVVRT